ncbi:MAG: hypothetical protein R6U22_08380 [Desulfohalobiaceae bacterium]
MDKLGQIGLTRKSLILLLASAVILAVITFFFILPVRSEIASLQTKAENLEAKIQDQEALQPLYAKLEKKLDQGFRQELDLEDFDKEFVSLDIEDAAQELETMAETAGLSQSTFSPVPNSLTENEQEILLEGDLEGEPQDFRRFLLKLIAWDNFSHLEVLEVFGRQDSTEYELQIWLNIG